LSNTKPRFFHNRSTDKTGPNNPRSFTEQLNEAIRRAVKMDQIKLVGENDRNYKKTLDPSKINAFTVCVIEDDKRNELARGYSFCTVQFSREEGRELSKERAAAFFKQKWG